MAQSTDPTVSAVSLAINKILVGMSPAAANAEALYQRILAQRSAFFSSVQSAHDKYLQRFVQLDDSLYTYDADGRPNGRTAISPARLEWAANVFPMIQLQARQLISDLVEFKKIGGLAGSETPSLDPRLVTAVNYMKGLANLSVEQALDVGYTRVSRNCMVGRFSLPTLQLSLGNYTGSAGNIVSCVPRFTRSTDAVVSGKRRLSLWFTYSVDSGTVRALTATNIGVSSTSSIIVNQTGSTIIDLFIPKGTDQIYIHFEGLGAYMTLSNAASVILTQTGGVTKLLFAGTNMLSTFTRLEPVDPEAQPSFQIALTHPGRSANITSTSSVVRAFEFQKVASDTVGDMTPNIVNDPFTHIDGLQYSSGLQAAVDDITNLVNSGDPDSIGAAVIVPDTIIDISNSVKGLFSLITESGLFSVAPNLLVPAADLP